MLNKNPLAFRLVPQDLTGQKAKISGSSEKKPSDIVVKCFLIFVQTDNRKFSAFETLSQA
jgi:hypothetical protein